MNQTVVQVLLVGKNARASSHLLWHLEERGCHCSLASSAEEGGALFQRGKFRLILGMNSPRQITRLVPLLGSPNCSAFYALMVEHGCWWLPVVKSGQMCLGAPALRPREFTSVLEQTLNEIRNHHGPAPKGLQETYDNLQALVAAS